MNSDLKTALDELSQAHGPKELALAHGRLQASIRRKRQKLTSTLGPLASAVEECLVIRDQMKASGVTGDTLNAGMAEVLKQHWPRQRQEPWHYVCERCCDSGAEHFECPEQKCDRDFPHGPHSFIRPCFCPKGRRFQEKPPPTQADSLEKAAKPTKPTRWGRT